MVWNHLIHSANLWVRYYDIFCLLKERLRHRELNTLSHTKARLTPAYDTKKRSWPKRGADAHWTLSIEQQHGSISFHPQNGPKSYPYTDLKARLKCKCFTRRYTVPEQWEWGERKPRFHWSPRPRWRSYKTHLIQPTRKVLLLSSSSQK